MELLKEMKWHGFEVKTMPPAIHCKVFEDNSGALEIAKFPKARPRTKHLNVKLHHFCGYVEQKEVTIHPIASEEQPSDILTKPVNEELLAKHWKTMMGWWWHRRKRECSNYLKLVGSSTTNFTAQDVICLRVILILNQLSMHTSGIKITPNGIT